MVEFVVAIAILMWNVVGILIWFGLAVWLLKTALAAVFRWLLTRKE